MQRRPRRVNAASDSQGRRPSRTKTVTWRNFKNANVDETFIREARRKRALTAEEHNEIKKKFEALSPVMHRHQLQTLLQQLGEAPTEVELTEILTEISFPADGKTPLDFASVERLMQERKRRHLEKAEENVHTTDSDGLEAFVALGGNTDETGFITTDALITTYTDFNLNVDIHRMVNEFAAEKGRSLPDCRMDYAEFMSVFDRINRYAKHSTPIVQMLFGGVNLSLELDDELAAERYGIDLNGSVADSGRLVKQLKAHAAQAASSLQQQQSQQQQHLQSQSQPQLRHRPSNVQELSRMDSIHLVIPTTSSPSVASSSQLSLVVPAVSVHPAPLSPAVEDAPTSNTFARRASEAELNTLGMSSMHNSSMHSSFSTLQDPAELMHSPVIRPQSAPLSYSDPQYSMDIPGAVTILPGKSNGPGPRQPVFASMLKQRSGSEKGWTLSAPQALPPLAKLDRIMKKHQNKVQQNDQQYAAAMQEDPLSPLKIIRPSTGRAIVRRRRTIEIMIDA